MSNFWKLVAMGATAAAAYVIAKEVVDRHEKGEDCSPKAVFMGIGKKIGKFFEEKCGCYYEDDFDDFDDFEDFELDDEDTFEFDGDDMESDKLTDDGYILEFSADEEEKPEEAPAPETEAAPEEAAETAEEEKEEE